MATHEFEELAEFTKRNLCCITMVPEEELRRRNVFLAKFAERAERYDDMRKYMDSVGVNVGPQELSDEERDLLFAAYRKVIGELRKARKSLICFEEAIAKVDADLVLKAGDYREKIEDEMRNRCDTILNLLDTRLIPSCQAVEIKVFYLKMKGDFLRYRAEMTAGASVKEAEESTLRTYTLARDLASEKLNPTHPTRLGLALNLSVFYNDIMGDTQEALSSAKQAFDEAVGEIVDKGDEGEYIDETKHIIQLLRDIDSIWTSNMLDEEGT